MKKNTEGCLRVRPSLLRDTFEKVTVLCNDHRVILLIHSELDDLNQKVSALTKMVSALAQTVSALEKATVDAHLSLIRRESEQTKPRRGWFSRWIGGGSC